VSYSKKQAFEMLLAVGLEHVGQTPRIAALIAQDIMRYLSDEHAKERRKRSRPPPLFVLIHPSTDPSKEIEGSKVPGWTFCIDSFIISRLIDECKPVYSIMNVTACFESFEQEVARATAA
jgi:hypothetical protein